MTTSHAPRTARAIRESLEYGPALASFPAEEGLGDFFTGTIVEQAVAALRTRR